MGLWKRDSGYHEGVADVNNKGIEIWANGPPFVIYKHLKATHLVLMKDG